jgi:hypothetical protein
MLGQKEALAACPHPWYPAVEQSLTYHLTLHFFSLVGDAAQQKENSEGKERLSKTFKRQPMKRARVGGDNAGHC